jgi:endonuclease/exonuclease/phosphatase family metal-dependent hydrolase
MSQKIKIATFNCENLFSRTKIFKEDNSISTKLLAAVAKLQEELKKPVFNQEEIKKLKKELAGYVTINDIRLKHDKAGIGAKEWFGWIEFVKTPAEDLAIQNLARVISDIDADIICLIEVENRTVLQKFHDSILNKDYLKPQKKKEYKHIMLIDGNDDRGIDVGVMSRYPINMIKSYIDDVTEYLGKSIKTFSRDCLHIQVDIMADKPLNIFINHLKSQGYSGKSDPSGNIRRKGQASRVAAIIKELNLTDDYIIVAGDMNCDPQNPSLEPLLNNNDLYNLNLELPADERWTYINGKKQLDYLIVTRPLEQKLQKVYVERRGVFPSIGRYETVTSKTSEASDHAAVVAEFEF